MDIRQLIPQRAPMLMVDELTQYDGTTALTTFTVRADNPFIDSDGLLTESALIENMAQSASALAGKRALDAGAEKVPTGYIGEVKKFCCQHRPAVGAVLSTEVHWGLEVGDITFVSATVREDGQTVAETELKVYLSKD